MLENPTFLLGISLGFIYPVLLPHLIKEQVKKY